MVFTIRDFIKNSTGVEIQSDTVALLNNRNDYALLYCNPKCITVDFDIITGKKKSGILLSGSWKSSTARVILGPQETYEILNEEDTTGAVKENVDIKVVLVNYYEITEINPDTGKPYVTSELPVGYTPTNVNVDAGPATGSNITDEDFPPGMDDKSGWTWLYVIIALVVAGLIGYVLYRMVKEGKFKDIKSKAHSVAEKIKGD